MNFGQVARDYDRAIVDADGEAVGEDAAIEYLTPECPPAGAIS